MAKKKNLGPRRKRMSRQARLQAAKHWIPTYTGKNLFKGYRNHYGVDIHCAIKEFQLLGIPLDPEYITQLIQAVEQTALNKKKNTEAQAKRKKLLAERDAFLYSDSDDHFAFIAGYTSGGAAYGITWEEMGELPF